jgi:hypothetical protein
VPSFEQDAELDQVFGQPSYLLPLPPIFEKALQAAAQRAQVSLALGDFETPIEDFKRLYLEIAFGLDVAKGTVEEHGVLTPEYIDYNRQDVRVTWALYRELMAEWRRHPIALAPEREFMNRS